MTNTFLNSSQVWQISQPALNLQLATGWLRVSTTPSSPVGSRGETPVGIWELKQFGYIQIKLQHFLE